MLARVAGVDVESVIRATWLLGGALACAAGIMIGITVQIRPFMGFDFLLPLFAAAILGGIGSVPGAVLGGLDLGIAEALAVQIVGADYRAAVAFLILIAVLLVRPAGLFGATRMILDLRRLCRVLPDDSAELRHRLPRPQSAMGTDRPLQCRRRRIHRDRRLCVGAADHAGAGGAARRLRPADRSRGGWRGAAAAGLCAASSSARYPALARRLSRHHHLRHRDHHPSHRAQRRTLTGGPFGIAFIPRPFAGLRDAAVAFNLANLMLVGAVASSSIFGARTAGAQSVGPGAAGDPRGRDGGAVARQERQSLPPAGVRAGQRDHGTRRRHAGDISSASSHRTTTLPTLTFQVWAMLIVGGSGNNRGALLGAVVVMGTWIFGCGARRFRPARAPGARRGAADRRDRDRPRGCAGAAAEGNFGRENRRARRFLRN